MGCKVRLRHELGRGGSKAEPKGGESQFADRGMKGIQQVLKRVSCTVDWRCDCQLGGVYPTYALRIWIIGSPDNKDVLN